MSAGSYSISGDEMMARARTIASQTLTDANQATIIDAKGGIRALLNHSINEVYRRKCGMDAKFRHDINTDNVITLTGGQGDVPEGLMREMLHTADITDSNGFSLISYLDYSTDAQETFSQIGYLYIKGDTFYYIAPAPDLDSFDGDITIQCPKFPTFPNNLAQDIAMPSQATAEDVILFLSAAILGKENYQIVTA